MPYLLILFLFGLTSLEAKDFGSFGPTFPIQEEDLMLVLQKRLVLAQQDEMQKAFIATVEKPKGKPFPKARKLRAYDYDPTLTVQEEIQDSQGKTIVAKGTKVNPLDQYSLTEDLLFFDGDDPRQVAWAKSLQGKWILTNGKPLELEKLEEKPVYFDQGGYLTKKLGIQALPAKVSQKDRKLKVEEVPCS
jgi:conjugal transfer pilus assembly protein TraW